MAAISGNQRRCQCHVVPESVYRSIDSRGSNEFVAHIMKNSSIPVLGHADGICHIYLDSQAHIDKAVSIVLDAKMQYCAVCNAVETLLVHSYAAAKLLPPIKNALEAAGCRLRGCEKTQSIIEVPAAADEDWSTNTWMLYCQSAL